MKQITADQKTRYERPSRIASTPLMDDCGLVRLSTLGFSSYALRTSLNTEKTAFYYQDINNPKGQTVIPATAIRSVPYIPLKFKQYIQSVEAMKSSCYKTVAEYSKETGAPLTTIYGRISSGQLKTIKCGRELFIQVASSVPRIPTPDADQDNVLAAAGLHPLAELGLSKEQVVRGAGEDPELRIASLFEPDGYLAVPVKLVSGKYHIDDSSKRILEEHAARMDSSFVTERDLLESNGLSRRDLLRFISSGMLDPIKLGKRTFYQRSHIPVVVQLLESERSFIPISRLVSDMLISERVATHLDRSNMLFHYPDIRRKGAVVTCPLLERDGKFGIPRSAYDDLVQACQVLERNYISVKRSARRLGVKRQFLHKLLNELDIDAVRCGHESYLSWNAFRDLETRFKLRKAKPEGTCGLDEAAHLLGIDASRMRRLSATSDGAPIRFNVVPGYSVDIKKTHKGRNVLFDSEAINKITEIWENFGRDAVILSFGANHPLLPHLDEEQSVIHLTETLAIDRRKSMQMKSSDYGFVSVPFMRVGKDDGKGIRVIIRREDMLLLDLRAGLATGDKFSDMAASNLLIRFKHGGKLDGRDIAALWLLRFFYMTSSEDNGQEWMSTFSERFTLERLDRRYFITRTIPERYSRPRSLSSEYDFSIRSPLSDIIMSSPEYGCGRKRGRPPKHRSEEEEDIAPISSFKGAVPLLDRLDF